MLFQPSNIYPSTFSGIGAGTIDADSGINVSWQVNGDTPMTAYRIKIYQNDSQSTEMYDSGVITVSPAFEPHDKYGNPTFFQTVISAADLATAGIVNGYQYGYKMLITQYWTVSDYVEQTSASVFITRSTPTLAINAIQSPVTTSSLTITASYSQTQGDPISTVEWVFALAGSESNPIKKTGAVNTQVLSFDADGLISGNTYSVMCNVVTSNGMEISTGFVQFNVSYNYSSITINNELAQLKNSSGVVISWAGIGNNILSYPYTDTTKTTNGITFTVNGEGDITVTGTATADAKFAIAQGTLQSIGLMNGGKYVISSGYQGSKIEVTQTNSSNVVVSTVSGYDFLQYVAPSTTNELTIYVVIPSGTQITDQKLQPLINPNDEIATLNSLTVNIIPTQTGSGAPTPSNIRPITGPFTDTDIYVSSVQNTANAITYNVSWPTVAGGIYGGNLNVPLGQLSATMLSVDLGTLNWVQNSSDAVKQTYRTSGLRDYIQSVEAADLPNALCSAFGIETRVNMTQYPASHLNTIGVTSGGLVEVLVPPSSYASAADFKSAVSGFQFVYEAATPTAYQVQPEITVTIYGQNYVWGENGGVDLSYTKQGGGTAFIVDDIASFNNSNAVSIPYPQYYPAVNSIAIYRYEQGDSLLHRVFTAGAGTTSIIDYYAPSQKKISYLLAISVTSGTIFAQTDWITPVFWFYSLLLCDKDANGNYHVSQEYLFRYGVESASVSNNNSPTLQANFTKYPNRQPISSLYKTGKITSYIGTVDAYNIYTDSVSLQNAMYRISTSTLTKFLKTIKGDVIMVDTSGPITMKTEDKTTQQALVATVEWAEVGDASDVSVVSEPTDGFWPL